MKTKSTLIFILLIAVNSSALTDDYIFKQHTVSDGLSQSTVFASIQDSRGYMWFGTINGLNRFDGYEFKVYTNNPADSSSISDNFISALFEDDKDFIWVGTINGNLNKFDRKNETFTRFKIDDYFEQVDEPETEYYEYPLAFSRNQLNSITSITEDTNGYLWIGTWGNGLIKFNKENKTATHIFHNPKDSFSLSHNRVRDIHIDDDGNLWVATFGGGLNRAVKENQTDSLGFIYSINQIVFDHYKHDSKYKSSLSNNQITKLFEDRDKNLWIGTYDGGLEKLDYANRIKNPANAVFKHFIASELTANCICNNKIMAIVQDNDGYLWIGTFGGGIDRMKIETETFIHFSHDPSNQKSLPDNDILSLLADKSGILWIGSHLGQGVTQFQKNITKFNLINKDSGKKPNLNDDVVWSVYEDSDQNLWVGMYRGGLNFVNRKTNRSTVYQFVKNNINSLSDNHIRSIEEDKFNNLWIATYSGGLNRLNKTSGKIDRFTNNPNDPNSLSANQVQDILIESDTVIWAATFGGGLNKLTFINDLNETPSVTRYENDPDNSESISDNRVYKLLIDSEDNFWVGTYGGGLNKFDRTSGTFKNYLHSPDDPNSISNNIVLSLLEDSEGMIWIGTSGGSLNKFNPKTYKATMFSVNQGLTSSVVYGILEDNERNLWLSTDNGIYKFNIEIEKFTQFGLEDGLQSLEFSGGAYYKNRDGLMYFGGINGLNYFYPDSITTNNFIPPIVISSVKLFHENIKGEHKELILSHDQNFISFEFAALDYTNPQRNMYAFKLEGLEKNWENVNANLRRANYTNLPSGEYIFRIVGANPDGIWNTKGASIKLIITPPYWQTWWFVSLVLIVLGIIVYYISTLSIKNQLAVEQLKAKIATDLHDNVGAGLTEISILSEVAANRMRINSVNDPKEFNRISNISRELVDNMSDIVWVVNPQRDSLYDLIIKLKDSYNEFMNSVGISFRVKNIDKTDDVRLPMEYKQNLLMMFKEAINNAIKHSNCKKITLEANVKNDIIELTLTDDGTGIDKSKNKTGNGISNMESRAEKLGGSVKVISVLNGGTQVIFIAKLSRFKKIKSFFKRYS